VHRVSHRCYTERVSHRRAQIIHTDGTEYCVFCVHDPCPSVRNPVLTQTLTLLVESKGNAVAGSFCVRNYKNIYRQVNIASAEVFAESQHDGGGKSDITAGIQHFYHTIRFRCAWVVGAPIGEPRPLIAVSRIKETFGAFGGVKNRADDEFPAAIVEAQAVQDTDVGQKLALVQSGDIGKKFKQRLELVVGNVGRFKLVAELRHYRSCIQTTYRFRVFDARGNVAGEEGHPNPGTAQL
jgi:hypothetical protein